ncbi:hypothetical protein AVEN_105304-1 [Araneus ventricosus]|uniref:Uncharacterized protein n=1 Tax=Araneus ventricosus TaxID=182803 RepID=A0A4Y2RFH5_ARAVE|nr:hypothetical protein AVEN_173479-1 [Araneus ventricosus]GBN74593.1 hypothetical protein AVEN_105304-1 [Araneus ventricosus]
MMSPGSQSADDDDHIVKQLMFSDSEADDHGDDSVPPVALYTSSPVKTADSSPIETNTSLSSVSDEDRLNSSTDSVVNMNVRMRRPVLRQIRSNDEDTTPPYRKVRALRLFGSPKSPKTLLKRSELSTVECNRTKTRLFATDKNHNLLHARNTPVTFRSPQLEANINPFYYSDVLPTSLGKRRRDDSGLNE